MKPLFILVGPSGSGKTTLARKSGLRELISHTTRPMRLGEVEGVDYYYVTKEEFDKIPMVEVVEFNGNFYGSSKVEFDVAEIVVAEPHGVMQLRNLCNKTGRWCRVIAVLCRNPEVYRERMLKRGDDPARVEQRLENDKRVFANVLQLADLHLYSDDPAYLQMFLDFIGKGVN